MDRIWKPNVTVAAIIERDGRFLFVEEETDDGIRFNQPAGHLDEGESLVDAAARDHGILRALWLTPEEIAAEHARHRSPLVMQCVRDYLAGRRFGLDLITHYET